MRLPLLFGSLCLLLVACQPAEDPAPVTDPRLGTRKYCNDPDAVNYNWDFPGKPDSSVCLYPSDLFKGSFSYRDSVYLPDGTLDSARSLITYALRIFPLDRNRIGILGFCGPADTLKLSAPRTGFRASIDTTALRGQILCRPQDTVSGAFTRTLADTARLQLQFTVVSDTAVNLHRGTAYRQ